MLIDIHSRFIDPPVEFSPVPMWFLNGDLTEAELNRQLCDFASKGVMGVILHPRIGLSRDIGYLSKRFIAMIRFAVERAHALGMRVILYDEGMYPSGSACGMVCRENPSFASRGIMLKRGAYALCAGERLVARLCVRLAGESSYEPTSVRLLIDGEAPLPDETLLSVVEGYTGGTIRGVHEGQDDGEKDAPPSADILNPDAVRCFIRLTHQRYYDELAPFFGSTITAMFTDEPCPMGRCVSEGLRAWTNGLELELPRVGLTLSDLPALWLDAGELTASIRAAYDALIDLRLGEVFYNPLSDWCEAHGIMLTGHPARSGDIALQRYFGVPGQDLVWRMVSPESCLSGEDSVLAKCASDSALHWGRRRNACECFGCCGKDGNQWSFSVDDMLFYLNWLFVRGVNTIYPHAFFYAMDTHTQLNDRPPDVGPNNIWWSWYGQISKYIASTCALLTDSTPIYTVAIACSGTAMPWRLAGLLFERQIPFAYLDASIPPERIKVSEGAIHIAGQRYEALAFEDALLVRDESAKELLDELRHQGGHALILGEEGLNTVEDMADALSGMGLNAVMAEPQSNDIRVLPLRKGRLWLYYLSNEGEVAWQGILRLPVRGYCERLDPWTNEIVPLPMPDYSVELNLNRREAVFLVVDADSAPALAEPKADRRFVQAALKEPWSARWQEGSLSPAPLGDWQQWQGMELYSGTVTYSTAFVLNELPAALRIRLGQVRDIARVTLNDGASLPLLKAPYECDLTADAKPGINTLTVNVTSNRMSELESKPCPCGLFGPVGLEIAYL